MMGPQSHLGQNDCHENFFQKHIEVAQQRPPKMGPLLAISPAEEALPRFQPGEVAAIHLCPLEKLARHPEVVVVYGNPSQLMHLIQAVTFSLG
jgi:Uncharacterised ArCR, COG2043